MTAKEILIKAFNRIKEKYPADNWKTAEQCAEEFEFVYEAMEEYAQQESVEFKEWADKLTPTQKCTVHPPAGSGGGYGLYELTTSELYQQFKNKL